MSASAAIPDTILAYPVRWVTLKRYCELSGQTKEAVLSRRRKGDWLDGKHTKVKNRRLYVNVPEADRWVEQRS